MPNISRSRTLSLAAGGVLFVSVFAFGAHADPQPTSSPQPTGTAVVSPEFCSTCGDPDICIPETEVCNGFDDDCDGAIDEGVKVTVWKDADGDGYGNPSTSMQDCGPSAGWVTNNSDCNDSNNLVYSGATKSCGVGTCARTVAACLNGAEQTCVAGTPSAEICNGKDDDCDASTDEGVQPVYYRDADGDTYGAGAAITSTTCGIPTGYVARAGDCDDSRATVKPGGTEVCNGLDDNCSGALDEGVKTTFYQDSDGDTQGSPTATTQACSVPAGYVTNKTDCDDKAATTYLGAPELCNGIDDDCDGVEDENLPRPSVYVDGDKDGYGAGSLIASPWCVVKAGYSQQAGDCDDTRVTVNPGAAEVCDRELFLDNNCNGVAEEGLACSPCDL